MTEIISQPAFDEEAEREEFIRANELYAQRVAVESLRVIVYDNDKQLSGLPEDTYND